MNIMRFYLYKYLVKHTLNLTMFTSQYFENMFTHFFNVTVNTLQNRYYVNAKDVTKASQSS